MFPDMKRTALLLCEGKSSDDIVSLALEKNIYQLDKPKRRRDVPLRMIKRLSAIGQPLVIVIANGSDADTAANRRRRTYSQKSIIKRSESSVRTCSGMTELAKISAKLKTNIPDDIWNIADTVCNIEKHKNLKNGVSFYGIYCNGQMD